MFSFSRVFFFYFIFFSFTSSFSSSYFFLVLSCAISRTCRPLSAGNRSISVRRPALSGRRLFGVSPITLPISTASSSIVMVTNIYVGYLVGVLIACSHTCLVEEAQTYFDEMRKEHGWHYGHTLEHYDCMVDVLGRAEMLRGSA